MSKAYVYKITRVDGLQYIGITVNKENRFASHKKSDRFSIGIMDIEILKECDDYEEAESLEEFYIQKLDTFNSGLNMTPNGKGKNENTKFNTLGHKFSDDSRKKMSESAKRRGLNTPKGYKHSEETRKNWSEKRKGVYWGNNKKISDDDCLKIYESFLNDDVNFGKDFLKGIVKKSQIDQINELSFDEMISKNGKPLTKKIVYSHYYAERYNVTKEAIWNILQNKGERCDRSSKK